MFKDLSKTWKVIIAICGGLTAVAGGIEGYKAIKGEIKSGVISYTRPFIQSEVKAELDNQKKSKESSYRYQRAEAFGIPMDSLLIVDKMIYNDVKVLHDVAISLDSVNMDRVAIVIYLQSLSQYIWREMEPRHHKNVNFGYSPNTGLTFYMFNGLIFEAYYKGSTDSYWFKDSYGIERECK